MTNTPPATIHLGDCIEVMRMLPENSVDAVITDPPYGLGFMGKAWDELPPGEEWARECLRVLKPGGHLLAFGGSRTWHRLAVAVEDAGFEVRDSIAWLYGSGFPKSLDVSKAIDKRPGVTNHAEFGAALREAMVAKGYTNTFDVAERVIGRRTGAVANWIKYQFPEAKWWPALRDLLDMDEAMWGPVIAEAERQKIGTRTTGIGTGKGTVSIMGDGNRDLTASATPAAQQWQGWGTALKPAFEPIVVARKPLAAGTVAANVLAHGTGALNIDGCRVAGEPWKTKGAETGIRSVMIHDGAEDADSRADIMFREKQERSGNPAGRWPANVVLDESQAAALDQMSGVIPPSIRKGNRQAPSDFGAMGDYERAGAGYNDKGGASRFFYVAKAPTRERPKVDGVAHPTVKPLALMRWLVRLVTPPGGTVLEPFAGSGTTVEACALEGFACIAIEREPDYLPLIQARLARVEAAQPEPAGPSLFDIGETA